MDSDDEAVATSSGMATSLRVDGDVHDDYTVRYFLRALVSDTKERGRQLEALAAHLRQPGQRALLAAHAARLARMANSCPLRNWRDVVEALLAEARAAGLPVPRAFGVSRFFAREHVVAPLPADDATRKLFREQFLETGRLSYLQRILAFLPRYAARFRATQRELMREPGTLNCKRSSSRLATHIPTCLLAPIDSLLCYIVDRCFVIAFVAASSATHSSLCLLRRVMRQFVYRN
jgi:hypothetical protein